MPPWSHPVTWMGTSGTVSRRKQSLCRGTDVWAARIAASPRPRVTERAGVFGRTEHLLGAPSRLLFPVEARWWRGHSWCLGAQGWGSTLGRDPCPRGHCPGTPIGICSQAYQVGGFLPPPCSLLFTLCISPALSSSWSMCKQFPFGWGWQRFIGLALGAKILFIQGRFLFSFQKFLSLPGGSFFSCHSIPPLPPRCSVPSSPSLVPRNQRTAGKIPAMWLEVVRQRVQARERHLGTDAPEMGWISGRHQFNPFHSLRFGVCLEEMCWDQSGSPLRTSTPLPLCVCFAKGPHCTTAFSLLRGGLMAKSALLQAGAGRADEQSWQQRVSTLMGVSRSPGMR